MSVLGHIVAPLAGAAALLAALFVLRADAYLAIVIGGLVWAGLWFLDRHRRTGGRDRALSSTGSKDLMAAASRLETIRAAAITVQLPEHRAILLRVTDTAGDMLDQAFGDTVKRRRYRKALGHRLWHVEALATRIIGLEQSGQPDADLMAKATGLLERIHSAMIQVRQAATEADEQDLDVRLSVIESEMDQELSQRSVSGSSSSS